MGDADLFRQYAEEAMHGSSKATSENEKRTLADLACTWAQAALMSERVLGSSFVSSPRDISEAASHARS
jgi:hypothetical protein